MKVRQRREEGEEKKTESHSNSNPKKEDPHTANVEERAHGNHLNTHTHKKKTRTDRVVEAVCERDPKHEEKREKRVE